MAGCGLRTTLLALLLCTACASAATVPRDASPAFEPASESELESASTSAAVSTTSSSRPPLQRTGTAPPEWLGTVELELRPGEDNGVAQPTPPELLDRRLWTTDVLAPPLDNTYFSLVSNPPPDGVIARSTWRPECPVTLDELSYVQVAFVGFDGLFHTGELLVHRDFAGGVVEVFGELYEMGFPIEEMRVTTQEAVDAAPTGDSNNTSSFVCRAAVNSGSWSRHAHGGAIDLNPFHNPYVKGDLVIPELATAYLDRDRDVPGMVTLEIEALFADRLGWSWGGTWQSASDWMHFSDTGG